MSAPQPMSTRLSVAELLANLRPQPHAPLSAMVEIADRCNEACVHCYQVQGEKGELTTDEWKGIIDQLAEMGVFILTFSGGEATLRKDLLELVAHARKRSFVVKLFTNGLRVTEAMATELAELGVMEASISLYSHDAAIHDGVTRVPGSFEKTVTAARLLAERGILVVLKTPLMSMNADGIDEYVSLVQSLGAHHQVDTTIDPREDGDASPEQYRIDDEHYFATLRHPAIVASMEPGHRELDTPVCSACSGHVHIEANGEMRPCTQLQVPVGHALRDGVKEAWENDPAGRQIRQLTWADLPGCRACDLRHDCQRCFAAARVEAADAFAPYASACRKAWLNYEVVYGTPPRVFARDREDVEMGPYRRVGDGEFVTISVELTESDRARLDASAWARAPEKLVQLRRRSHARPPEGTPIEIE